MIVDWIAVAGEEEKVILVAAAEDVKDSGICSCWIFRRLRLSQWENIHVSKLFVRPSSSLLVRFLLCLFSYTLVYSRASN